MLPRSRVALAFLIALPLLLLGALWQTARRRPRLQGILSSPPMALALSHNGSVVAAQRSGGTLCLWPRGGTRLDLQSEGFTNASNGTDSGAELQFSPDERTLLGSNLFTQGSGSSLYSWDTATGKIKWSVASNLPGNRRRYWTSSDGTRAVGRAHDMVQVFDISGVGGQQVIPKSKFARSFPLLSRFQARGAKIKGGTSLPQTLCLSPDNKTLAVVNTAEQLEFWDVAKGQRQFQAPPAPATGSAPGPFPAPPVVTGVTVVPPGAATGFGVSYALNNELRYSPDGRFVALFDGTALLLWDVAARKWLSRAVAVSSSEAFLAWMPDSRSIWTSAGSVQQWSVPDLQSLREIPMTGPIAVSGDGRVLATRALDDSGAPNGVWTWEIG